MQRSNLDRLTSEATFEATSEASEATSDAQKDGKDGGNSNQETPAERVLAPSHDGDHDGAGDDYDAPDVRGFHVQQPFAYDRLVQSGGGFEQVEVVLTDLLLTATRTGRNAEAVRALGERLTKAKRASL